MNLYKFYLFGIFFCCLPVNSKGQIDNDFDTCATLFIKETIAFDRAGLFPEFHSIFDTVASLIDTNTNYLLIIDKLGDYHPHNGMSHSLNESIAVAKYLKTKGINEVICTGDRVRESRDHPDFGIFKFYILCKHSPQFEGAWHVIEQDTVLNSFNMPKTIVLHKDSSNWINMKGADSCQLTYYFNKSGELSSSQGCWHPSDFPVNKDHPMPNPIRGTIQGGLKWKINKGILEIWSGNEEAVYYFIQFKDDFLILKSFHPL